MNIIINFYKELDTLNLIIFWGIIIVIVLLLIFAIVISNKNRKLKVLLEKKEENYSNEKNNINIVNDTKKEDVFKNTYNEPIISNDIKQEQNDIPKILSESKEEKELPEEKEFIAEEHVITYHDYPQQQELSSGIDNTPIKNEKIYSPIEDLTKRPTNVPYQKNVLREMSLNQTSPIGITKPIAKEETKAKELNDVLLEKVILEDYPPKASETINTSKSPSQDLTTPTNKNRETNFNSFASSSKEIDITIPTEESLTPKYQEKKEDVVLSREKTNIQKYQIEEPKDTKPNDKYLEEVSNKLSTAKNQEGIIRTEYELKQEEEAIISYEELMKKKDSIQIVDEEEAVISIDELMKKKNEGEKLYNLSPEEENDKFLKELKSFRHDL